VRGGGDLASGVALRLHRAGLRIVISELREPLAVRRTVAFSEAIYEGRMTVEGVTAQRAAPDEIDSILTQDQIPILVDPTASILADERYTFRVLVDARMLKTTPQRLPARIALHIGLGPGFRAGRDCDAVIETRRSHTLGRVYWDGTTQADSAQPEGDSRRVLRAPQDGILQGVAKIGTHVDEGDVIADVAGVKVTAPFAGILRGLIRPGLAVTKGEKIGDVDLREDAAACLLVSDKSLAIGGAILEAILSKPDLRASLWQA
ncbi:MAG TPA: selenium-dependent molybdenum cofactor biosynthesis protein YqeB, partial [Anaerolineales bacterium]|jgi:xanthine dehydrogenase accessory factor